MSLPDYEIHVGSRDLGRLLGDEEELFGGQGLWEDPDELQKMIDEELGAPRRRPRAKKRQ